MWPLDLQQREGCVLVPEVRAKPELNSVLSQRHWKGSAMIPPPRDAVIHQLAKETRDKLEDSGNLARMFERDDDEVDRIIAAALLHAQQVQPTKAEAKLLAVLQTIVAQGYEIPRELAAKAIAQYNVDAAIRSATLRSQEIL